MLCIDEQQKVFETICTERFGVVNLTAVQLYLFMILGICLRIMCLMPSMWKVQSNEIAKRSRDDAMLASTYPVQGSANEVNHSGANIQVVSCHRYLVISHLFVEELASRLLYISTIVYLAQSEDAHYSCTISRLHNFSDAQNMCEFHRFAFHRSLTT